MENHVRCLAAFFVLAVVQGCQSVRVDVQGADGSTPSSLDAGSSGLFLEKSDDGKGTLGSYTSGDESVFIEVKQDLQSGATTARYSSRRGPVVEVRLEAGGDGTVSIGGTLVSGRGRKSDKEIQAIASLASSELATAIVMVPLEIGCMNDLSLTDVQRAALLMPWQVLLKYDSQFRSKSLAMEKDASCRYLGVNLDDPEAASSSPSGLQFSREDPIPHVFGYWPFDGEGAAAPSLRSHESEPIACKAECRGACGQGCSSNACVRRFEWYCVKTLRGNNGMKRLRLSWRCSTHAACRDHDTCYDNCNRTYGCNSWAAAQCRRACDQQCIAIYGADRCRAWVIGEGPSDSTVEMQHEVEGVELPDSIMCPLGDAPDSGTSMTDAGALFDAQVEVDAGTPSDAAPMDSAPPPPPPPACGNGACEAGESCASCNIDCFCAGNDAAPPPPYCGNGSCESFANESCATCSIDCCSSGGTYCGNGACEAAMGERCDNCSKDCGYCPPPPPPDGGTSTSPYCGNYTCEGWAGENCFTCSRDCIYC
ncbi:MAG: hypothetical protein HY698_20465 [Deltaproteobacteria bacterium]|nr:hypothetical protein [Deltaproteobacteria bacterium]